MNETIYRFQDEIEGKTRRKNNNKANEQKDKEKSIILKKIRIENPILLLLVLIFYVRHLILEAKFVFKNLPHFIGSVIIYQK